MESHPDFSVCFHPVTVHWDDNSKPDSIFPSEKSRFYKTELILDDLLKRNFIQTNSVLYRWRFHQDPLSLMPDDILPGDWFLHLLHAQVGKIGFLNDVMSVYRRHRGGVWTEAEQTTQWYTRYGIPCVRFWQNMQKRFGIDCSSQINDMALLTELCLSKAGQIDALSELKNIYPDIPDFPRFIRLKILLYSLMIPFMFGEARKKIRRQKRFLKKFIKFGENSYGKQN